MIRDCMVIINTMIGNYGVSLSFNEGCVFLEYA
jgi:hypothetical protein